MCGPNSIYLRRINDSRNTFWLLDCIACVKVKVCWYRRQNREYTFHCCLPDFLQHICFLYSTALTLCKKTTNFKLSTHSFLIDTCCNNKSLPIYSLYECYCSQYRNDIVRRRSHAHIEWVSQWKVLFYHSFFIPADLCANYTCSCHFLWTSQITNSAVKREILS